MQLFLEQIIDCHMVKLKYKHLNIRFFLKANLVGEIPAMMGNRKNKGH